MLEARVNEQEGRVSEKEARERASERASEHESGARGLSGTEKLKVSLLRNLLTTKITQFLKHFTVHFGAS